MRFAGWKLAIVSFAAGLVVFFAMVYVIMEQAVPILTETEFSKMESWSGSDKTGSLKAFRRSCGRMKQDDRAFSKKPAFGGRFKDWQAVCAISEKLGQKPTADEINSFFENHFTPIIVNDPVLEQGLFTGYFEPVVEGSLSPTDYYNIPVFKRPDDLVTFTQDQEKQTGLRYGRLVNGKPAPYYTRQEIEQGHLNGKGLELVWLKNRADAFFMQVQGSGRVNLPNGDVMRLAYAGKTGLPYTAIGGVLIADGELEKSTLSMQTIRQWMDENPQKSQSLMWKNKSFVFFRQLPEIDPGLGPVGAQHVNLTPHVSLAIDRRYWAFGTPIWLDTKIEMSQSESPKQWRSLLVAQDTGSAIRGYARGDVFWGSGDQAALIAGQMKAAGKMTVLLPKPLAQKLLDQ